jgi:hypothetical protein
MPVSVAMAWLEPAGATSRTGSSQATAQLLCYGQLTVVSDMSDVEVF